MKHVFFIFLVIFAMILSPLSIFAENNTTAASGGGAKIQNNSQAEKPGQAAGTSKAQEESKQDSVPGNSGSQIPGQSQTEADESADQSATSQPPEPPKPVVQPDPKSKEYILGLVKPVEVDAATNNNADIYTDLKSFKYIKTIAKGTKVKVIRDSQQKFAKVKLTNGTTGWIFYKLLNIAQNDYTGKKDLSDEQKNLYVNYKGYSSETHYLIWVNVERQKVNIYIGSKEKWKLNRSMACSSGKNLTPTINGEFKYYSYNSQIKFDNYYVVNFMRFHDTFAIHSIPFSYKGPAYDGRLGKPYSNGCIRVSRENSNWLVQYIPKGTKIVIN